jgi:putative transposase
MDEDHLLDTVRYVSLNPVRAGLVQRARDWPWSNVRAHLAGSDDALMWVEPILDRVPDFASLLAMEADDRSYHGLRAAETTGPPLGHARFLGRLERRLGRLVRPQKRGPKLKAKQGPSGRAKRKVN